MPASAPLRGQVYYVDIKDGNGPKFWLVVSNNSRNQKLQEVLVCRITTSPKPQLPSIIELEPADTPYTGSVLCDDIGILFKEEMDAAHGALRPSTMARVNDGLRKALAL